MREEGLADLGWRSAHLFGLSMGGGIAQLAALLHPVTRMATAPGGYDEEWGLKRASESYDRRPPDPQARQLFARRFDLPPGGIGGIKAPLWPCTAGSIPWSSPPPAR